MSEGPLISCSWFYDALFIIRKASPEGYLFQPSGVIKGRKVEVCEGRGKSFINYCKGPFIEMLRRNTPLWQYHLHVNSVKGYSKMTGRPPFLPSYSHEADIWKGYNFSMEDTRKGYLLSKIVYLRIRIRDWTSGRSLSEALLSSLPHILCHLVWLSRAFFATAPGKGLTNEITLEITSVADE